MLTVAASPEVRRPGHKTDQSPTFRSTATVHRRDHRFWKWYIYMRMRRISLRMTGCYYPSWKHSHFTHADYRLYEMPDVFSLCGLVELSRPNQRQSLSPTYSQRSPAPRHTPVAPREDHPISAACTCTSPTCLHEGQGETLPSAINISHKNIFYLCMSGGPWPTPAPRWALSAPLGLY